MSFAIGGYTGVVLLTSIPNPTPSEMAMGLDAGALTTAGGELWAKTLVCTSVPPATASEMETNPVISAGGVSSEVFDVDRGMI